LSDLFDTVIQGSNVERPAFRQAPPGEYLAIVRDAKKVKANTGTQGLELNFTLIEYFGTGDMDGVNLASCRCSDTQWVTENTMEYVKERLGRITPEVEGISFTDALDVLPGNEIVLKIDHQTTNRTTGEVLRTPRLDVKGYYSKDWYFNNRLKAA
jgi:hypothetical protein